MKTIFSIKFDLLTIFFTKKIFLNIVILALFPIFFAYSINYNESIIQSSVENVSEIAFMDFNTLLIGLNTQFFIFVIVAIITANIILGSKISNGSMFLEQRVFGNRKTFICSKLVSIFLSSILLAFISILINYFSYLIFFDIAIIIEKSILVEFSLLVMTLFIIQIFYLTALLKFNSANSFIITLVFYIILLYISSNESLGIFSFMTYSNNLVLLDSYEIKDFFEYLLKDLMLAILAILYFVQSHVKKRNV